MMNHQIEQGREGFRRKGWPLGQQMVKDCADGINIAPRADGLGLGLRLLGRYVSRSAEDLPTGCQMRVELLAARQAEVGNPRLIEDVNQDVGGFQVTVDGAVFVGKVNRVGDGPQLFAVES